MTGVVFLFPGQSSFDPDMLGRLRDAFPGVVAPLVEEAGAALGFSPDPREPGHPRDTNLSVQTAVFVASHAHLAVLAGAGVEAVASAGLSLGEYNHLVHIGALGFADALSLVRVRGECYDRGPDGAMAAIFPASGEEVEALVARVRRERGGDGRLLAVANYNSPSQQVAAGEAAAVERLMSLAEEELFAEARFIERRIPMHTPRFAPVAPGLRPHLADVPWRAPRVDYWPNVLGEPVARPPGTRIAELLARHVSEPVRWRHTVDRLVERHPGALFLEVGPGGVLHDLLSRKWHRVERLRADPGDAAAALAAHHRRVLEACG